MKDDGMGFPVPVILWSVHDGIAQNAAQYTNILRTNPDCVWAGCMIARLIARMLPVPSHGIMERVSFYIDTYAIRT